MRTCKFCGITYDLVEFHTGVNGRGYHYTSNKCMPCHRERDLANHIKNYDPVKNSKQGKKKRAKHGKKWNAWRRARYKRNKHDSVEWYVKQGIDGYTGLTHTSLMSF